MVVGSLLRGGLIGVLGLVVCLLVAGCQSSSSYVGRGLLDDLPRIADGRAQRVQKDIAGLKPGETIELANLKGPGVLRHWWFTARGGGERLYKDLVLRVWWDGESEPSVEVPLGDFFGIGWGEERDLRTVPIERMLAGSRNHSALNCWWPMPFESARIELEHQGDEEVTMFFWIINWEAMASLPDDLGRFHAQWKRQSPVPRGGPYVILDASGEGRYVGTIMNYHLLEPGSWVEGGERFYIDDDAERVGGEPTLCGIGSEDYFGLAWGYRPEYNLPFHGTSYGAVSGAGEVGGRVTAYRFHIPDPIRFKKRIRVEIRCFGWDVKERSDDYSSVAIWYQHEPHRPFAKLPGRDDRVPAGL